MLARIQHNARNPFPEEMYNSVAGERMVCEVLLKYLDGFTPSTKGVMVAIMNYGGQRRVSKS